LKIFNKYLKFVLAVMLIGMLMILYACQSYTPNSIEADEAYEIESCYSYEEYKETANYYFYEEYEDEIEIYYSDEGYDEEENISEYGLKVLKEFLMQFPTLFMDTSSSFSGGLPHEVGEIRHFGIPLWNEDEQVFETGVTLIERPTFDGSGTFLFPEWIKTSQTPPLFLRRTWTNDGLDGFYTANGERIKNVPWMLGILYATDFELYDFDDNGIPSVIVHYWGHYYGSTDGGPPSSLFRYVDGEFRRMYPEASELASWPQWFPWQGYYLDNEENLIGYFFGIVHAMPRYSFITFDGQEADLKMIVNGELDWGSYDWEEGFMSFYWHNHITGQSEEESIEYRGGGIGRRTIPATDINIRPLRPMRNLHDEITKYIYETMYEGGIFDDWLHILIATSTKMHN